MSEFGNLRARVETLRDLPSPAVARALREAAGISLRELARELGVDPTTLSRWERGLARPGRRDRARALLERYVAALNLLRSAGR